MISLNCFLQVFFLEWEDAKIILNCLFLTAVLAEVPGGTDLQFPAALCCSIDCDVICIACSHLLLLPVCASPPGFKQWHHIRPRPRWYWLRCLLCSRWRLLELLYNVLAPLCQREKWEPKSEGRWGVMGGVCLTHNSIWLNSFYLCHRQNFWASFFLKIKSLNKISSLATFLFQECSRST